MKNDSMKYFKLLAVTVFCTCALLSISCHEASVDPDRAIADASAQADAGNYADAVEACDNLLAKSDTSSLGATRLCKIAMIYLAAADKDVNNDANTAMALRCLEYAYGTNADSTQFFLDKLPMDQANAARMALALIYQQRTDMSQFVDPEDPSAIHDHDIDPEAGQDENHSHDHDHGK